MKNTASEIGIGLAHEFVITALKARWLKEDFARLAQNRKRLLEIIPFIRGWGKVQIVIDCDASPTSTYSGVKINRHRKMGIFEWSPKKITFAKYPENTSLSMEAIKQEGEKNGANANILRFLVSNPHLIPEKWKGEEKSPQIIFLGTIYEDRGEETVRYLVWNKQDEIWQTGYMTAEADVRTLIWSAILTD